MTVLQLRAQLLLQGKLQVWQNNGSNQHPTCSQSG
jgi:hypothetical protein